MSGTEKESSHRDHIEAAAGINAIGFAVITLSDTRTEATDKSGACLRDAIEAAGHVVARYQVVSDDPGRSPRHWMQRCPIRPSAL